MSWQSYIDDHICANGAVDARIAVIAGLDGSIWASMTDGANAATPTELKGIVDTMNQDPSGFSAKGIHIGGEKYVCISAEPGLIRGRKGGQPVIIVFTNTCVIAVVAKEGFPPGKLNNVVEKLGEHFRINDY